MQESQLRVFKNHAPCPKCGSKDNVAVYADGYEKCFTPGCSYYKYQNTSELCSINTIEKKQNLFTFDPITAKAIPERGIEIATVLDFNHIQADHNGQNVMVSTYVDQKGAPVCQKIRFPNKEFRTLGDSKAAMPYGYHLWKANQKAVLICEGEEDTMSIHQVMGSQIAVAGVPFGAGPQTQHFLKKNLEIFNQFNTIYLGFDNDEAGRLASKEAAELFANKKVRIISWRNKDANNSLQLGRSKEIEDAIWQAKVSTPDDILDVSEFNVTKLLDSCKESLPINVYPKLQKKLRGLREGGIYTIAASAKSGKSTFCRTLAHHLLDNGVSLGLMYLEDEADEVLKYLLGYRLQKSIWDVEKLIQQGGSETIKNALQYYKDKGLYLFDHKGSFDADKLLQRMRYLRVSLGVKVIIFDNFTTITTYFGKDLQETNRIIGEMIKLCKQTGIILINVCHLKKNVSKTKDGEDSHIINASDVYGTSALNAASSALIALEKRLDDNYATLKVISNRYGENGYADKLVYNHETGQITVEEHQPEILVDLDV